MLVTFFNKVADLLKKEPAQVCFCDQVFFSGVFFGVFHSQSISEQLLLYILVFRFKSIVFGTLDCHSKMQSDSKKMNENVLPFNHDVLNKFNETGGKKNYHCLNIDVVLKGFSMIQV